ncbi:hypothetical protein [Lawsonibacter sp. OA9]|nr:hypothetical protein [Lawsonibacter sp. OA9]
MADPLFDKQGGPTANAVGPLYFKNNSEGQGNLEEKIMSVKKKRN